MIRVTRLGLVCFTLYIGLAATLVSVPVLAQQSEAQQPAASSAKETAPVPAPIITGKTAFISNAGVDVDISPDHYSGETDRAYNQFYQAMKSWGRYNLTPAPGDADLIFEIRFTAPVGGVFDGRSWQDPKFNLVIMSARTRVVLWAFTEHLAKNRGTHDQSFDAAMVKIVDGIKKLAAPATVDAPNK